MPNIGGSITAVGDIQGVWHLDACRPRSHVLRPDFARACELFSQRLSQGLGQHQDAILTALARAHDHRLMGEVHILDSQLQGLIDAHSRPVEESRQQAKLADHAAQHRRHLLATQDNGQPPAHAWAFDLIDPRQVEFQHLRIQKQQC